jgi:hypothetical protein
LKPKDSTQKYICFNGKKQQKLSFSKFVFNCRNGINRNKKSIIDTLEYEMANPDGTLMGKGITDTKENKLFYKENFTFPKWETYF